MAECPDENCEKERKKDHDDVTTLKARWKALGVAMGSGLLILSLVMGVLDRYRANAQTDARAEVVAIKESDTKQNEEINNVKIDVKVIQKDIEYIKESQERIEFNNKEILKVLKKMNGDN